jgi:hypothetical protein
MWTYLFAMALVAAAARKFGLPWPTKEPETLGLVSPVLLYLAGAAVWSGEARLKFGSIKRSESRVFIWALVITWLVAALVFAVFSGLNLIRR